MRVTINRTDNLVYVDGVPKPVDCSGLPNNITAIQWNSEASVGHIEYEDLPNGGKPRNTMINDFVQYQAYVDAWNAYVFPTPPKRIPVITRQQAAKQLRKGGMITAPEAKQFAKNGNLPSFLANQVAALPQNQRDDAEIDLTASFYTRTQPVLIAALAGSGMTSAQIDQFFIDAAS